MKYFVALICVVAGVVMLPAASHAGESETILVKQDFEDQAAGQKPKNWKRSWGKQGNDLLVISSDAAAGGTNSLMLDRVKEGKKQMWAFATRIPNEKNGVMKIAFDFMIDGAGTDARFGCEIRGLNTKSGADRLFTFSFKGNKIVAWGFVKKVMQKPTLVGSYQPKTWYHAVLTFPASEADGKNVVLTINPLKKSSEQQEISVAMPFKFPDKGLGYFMPNVNPRNCGFKFYIDNFSISKVTRD